MTGIDNGPASQDLDGAAFDALARRNLQRAYFMALDLLQDAQEAEDAVQDAFLRALRSWSDFRGDSTPDTWLFRIVVNTCLNRRRRRGLWSRISAVFKTRPEEQQVELLAGRPPGPDAQLKSKASREAIRHAVSQLPEGQRTAFVLRYMHELSVREVAQATGNAEGTVKSHLFRAVRTLRGSLSALKGTDR